MLFCGGSLVSPGCGQLIGPGGLPAGRLTGMDTSPLTLDDELDEWFALQRTREEPSTWDSYATSLRAYVRPDLGQVPLASLTVR